MFRLIKDGNELKCKSTSLTTNVVEGIANAVAYVVRCTN